VASVFLYATGVRSAGVELVRILCGQKIEICLFTGIYALDIAHPPAYPYNAI
jgi:hypothetical protein